jgi:protein SCO1/2
MQTFHGSIWSTLRASCARGVASGALLLSLAVGAQAGPPPLPADSLYQIPPLTLRDQTGQTFDFGSLRGTPRLVGMFYASCQMACPIEIESIKQVEADVTAGGGQPVPVVLVSFDPKHDDVAALRNAAEEHHVSAPLFRFTRPEKGDEGMLAGALGVAYRALPKGGFTHNVVVALLDADGRILARTDASGKPDPAFVKAILLLQGHSTPAAH